MVASITRLLKVPGALLHTEALGPLDGSPLVMLHGGPGADSSYLRPQLDAIASMTDRGRPICQIYYDQRGARRSPLSEGTPIPGYQAHLEDLRQVLIAYAHTRVTLCGYSFGGLLALLYALAHPQDVARIILISPAPTYASARKDMLQRLSQSASRPETGQLRNTLTSETLSIEEQKRLRFAMAVVGYFYNPMLALELTPFQVMQRIEHAMWASLGDYDIRPQLPSVSHIPSLVLHGEDDIIPIETAQDTASRLHATFVKFARCGHVPYIEAKDALFASIRHFLSN